MADDFEIIRLSDAIISLQTLDKETVLNYCHKLWDSIDTLSLGDRECVVAACKKVIEWLSKQETEALGRKDWFSVVKKLCYFDKEKFVKTEQAELAQEIYRLNKAAFVESNEVLRLIHLCFAQDDLLYDEDMDKSKIDFKDWYGRISLLCSFLEMGWERLNEEQSNALRFCALTILRMIPAISEESEKIFIRSILRVVNRIIQMVSKYEGHPQFCTTIIVVYEEVIRKTSDPVDQENVITSLISNLKELNEKENSERIMKLLWRMVLDMCGRLREGGKKEGKKEKTNISPHADFHKSLDIWLSNFIQATIQDSLEEKKYGREEVCDWIISTLTSATYTIRPTFEEFEQVMRTVVSLHSSEHSAHLSLSLARLYPKLIQENIFDIEQQKRLVEVLFKLWNSTNERCIFVLAKKIVEGNDSGDLAMAVSNWIIDKEDGIGSSKERKVYLILEECISRIEMGVRAKLAARIVEKINSLDYEPKSEKFERRIMDRLHQLNIVFGKRSEEKKEEGEKKVSEDMFHFNQLLASDAYTRMVEGSMQAYFGMEKRKQLEENIPPINVVYGRRIVNGEKLLSYHHLHYFQIHAQLLKSKEYMDFIIAMNGGPNIEPLLNELCSSEMLDRMLNSMMRMMLNMREMYPLPLANRYNETIGYVVESVKDGTMPFLSPSTLKNITSVITSVELRFVLSQYSSKPEEREPVKPRILKLLQIAKCSLLSIDERAKLLDGVCESVRNAITAILYAYKEVPIPHDSLDLQHKLVTILRYHLIAKDLHPVTSSYMSLYLMERRLSSPSSSLQSLIIHLLLALCENPFERSEMEKNERTQETLSPYIVTPLMSRFTRLLLSIFSKKDSAFLPPIEWKEINMDMISNWLNEVGDANRGLECSLPLIVFLSKVVEGEGMASEPRSLILSYLDEHGPSFVMRMMRLSPCRPVFFHAMIPIMEYLTGKGNITLEVEDMLVESVPLLFSNPICEMMDFYPIEIQSTDRYAQTQLNWRSKRFPSVSDIQIDPIKESFRMMAAMSGRKRILFTMMEVIIGKMEEWLVNVHDTVMVLRGVAYDQTAEVVWRIQLISQGMAYLSCVGDGMRNREEGEGKEGKKKKEKEKSEYESDEEEVKKAMYLMQNDESDKIQLCTYATSSSDFLHQHWSVKHRYHCYSCGLKDSKGMCSVCVTTCHKGHDVAYSKLGSFFCDCGEKKCAAVKGVKKEKNMRRRKMKEDREEESYAPIVKLPEGTRWKEEIKGYMSGMERVMSLHASALNAILLGVESAHEGKFNIQKRRKNAKVEMKHPIIKYDECIMVGKVVESEALEKLDRRVESIDGTERREGINGRECSGIVRLLDGSMLYLYVHTHSSTLYIVTVAAGKDDEIGDARVERESLPFTPRRINVKGDHVVITGVDQVAFIRFQLESGEISYKTAIRIQNASDSNPIVKAIWKVEEGKREETMLAVATLQFVHVYHVYKDSDNFDVELVLPVGNLIDLAFIEKEQADYCTLIILTSPTHLYYHQLGGPGPEFLDETRSLYLTNTLPLPVHNVAVSMYFSACTQMLYLSFQDTLYSVYVEKGDIMEVEMDAFTKVAVEGEGWNGWSESSGVVGGLSTSSNHVLYLYSTMTESSTVLVQRHPLPNTALSIALAPSASFNSIVGIVLMTGRSPAMLYASNWCNQPDLWIEENLMRMEKISMVDDEDEEEEEGEEEGNQLFMETMEEVKEVEYSSRAMEEYYSTADLSTRLKTDKMPVICMSGKEEFDITIRVWKRQFEVKGLRLEVGEKQPPKSVHYNGKELKLNRRLSSGKTIYDIPLTKKETVHSERSLELRFICNDDGNTIIHGLKAYGESREKMFYRCLIYPSLPLSHQCVLHAMQLLHEMVEYGFTLPSRIRNLEGEEEGSDWIVALSLQVITPIACRPSINMMGKRLLRAYWKGETDRYYREKDAAVIQSLGRFRSDLRPIPSPIMRSYLALLIQMADKRYENLVKYATKFFTEVIRLCRLLRHQMEILEFGDPSLPIFAPSYVYILVSLLNHSHPQSKQIIQQLVQLITSQKTALVEKKIVQQLEECVVKVGLEGEESGMNTDWPEELVRSMTRQLGGEIDIPIPIWWKREEDVKEEKVDRVLQRALNGVSSLIVIGTSLLRELKREKIVQILREMIEKMDVISVMREEDEIREKHVRVGAVIAMMNEIGRRGEMDRKEGKDVGDKEWKGIIRDVFNTETIREKVMSLNFMLLEESLKYFDSIIESRRVSSSWSYSGDVGRQSTRDCLSHYYSSMGKTTLEFPCLIMNAIEGTEGIITTERKGIVCEMVAVGDPLGVREGANKVLLLLAGGNIYTAEEMKTEYFLLRSIDKLRFEFLGKMEYTHEDNTEMMDVITRVMGLVTERRESWKRICEANLQWLLLLASRTIETVGMGLIEMIQTAIKMDPDDDVPSRKQPSPTPYSIADTIIENVQTRNLLKVLIIKYILGKDEMNRWTMHSLCRSVMQLAKRNNQIALVRLLFHSILPLGRKLGERAAQLTDLCAAYLPTLLPANQLMSVANEEMTHLENMIERCERSEEMGDVKWMVEGGMEWREALYLSPDPCIDCLRPNETMEVLKLSGIKAEGRFSTKAMMYKLNGHYEISKVILKLADMKRTRMFGKVTVYYTQKWMESAVELKSERDKWRMVAATMVVGSESEVTLSLSIPIVTNALVIELSDFNDPRSNNELHCPRCSSLVSPNPGICDNCGENVYQCVKCRVINYDEKEPFLCSSCGYCKYARLDISVMGRLQPTMVMTSHNDKPMASRARACMNKLDYEMDMNRAELKVNLTLMRSLMNKAGPFPTVSYQVDSKFVLDSQLSTLPSICASDTRWNALTDCMRKMRSLSDALVSQSLQLMSVREAVRQLEHSHSPTAHSTMQKAFYNGSDRGCVGCLSSSLIHSISILRAMVVDDGVAAMLATSPLIYRRLVLLSRLIPPLGDEVESLLIKLSEREEGVEGLCQLVREGILSPTPLGVSLIRVKSPGWDRRMETLLEVVRRREGDEQAELTLLSVLIETMREGREGVREREEKKRKKKGRKEEKKEEEEGGEERGEEGLKMREMDREGVGRLMWRLLFSPSLLVRSLAGRMLRSVMSVNGQMATLLSIAIQGIEFARELRDSNRSIQFFLAFNCIVERGHVKLRLFQANFHLHLIGIILKECERLAEWERGGGTVAHSTASFISHASILLTNLLSGSWFEGLLLTATRFSLLLPLLHSTILLKRITIKRNRAIARSLHLLETLLRRCTGEERLSLLAASVSCLSELKDEKSRADVVEVILETLDPREKLSDEFLIQVEKDPAQEDFLQGRMQHNPYKSGDGCMGPLMRNIKDKICRESELIALLDDDNGMELLVNGKIISLSLPVKLVYEKVWKPAHPNSPMVIVYRMRGLLGDAVEPFVETIDEKDEGGGVDEGEAELLNAFFHSGGVRTTLDLFSSCTLSPNGCILMVQLRRLLVHLLKLQPIRVAILKNSGLAVLIGVLRKMREWTEKEGDSDQSMVAAEIDLLKMMDTLVADPSNHEILTGMSSSDTEWLLSLLDEEEEVEGKERSHSLLVQMVAKMLSNAVLGSEESEMILVKRFKERLNWGDLMVERREPTMADLVLRVPARRRFNLMDSLEREADTFTLIADGIQATEKGRRLKERLIEAGVVEDAVSALLYMHPPLYGTSESPEWKTYLARPGLKLILRLLKGMAKGDEKSQAEIAKRSLPILHRLEQVSSAEHLGTVAEGVMEELSMNKEVHREIDRVRDETKLKKRQMAMAMREKQLSRLGMKMGRGGEVTVSSRAIVNEPEVGEASDPLTSCCICRETILEGARVPAAYAFAALYRSEEQAVPTHYSLSLSVMVHVDCHHNAIRRSNGGRSADEWTKASLHNSGARCNILVPIPLAEPSQSDWTAALNRFQSDLEGIAPWGGPITRYRIFMDMTYLIRKFINNGSFSENGGGGGRESNMQYLAILHLLALHLPEGELPCGRASERLSSFLLTELSVAHWNEERLDVLRVFMRDTQIQWIERGGGTREPMLVEAFLQWAFIDLYFNRVIPMDGEDRFKWLQSHFGETLKRTMELVKYFDSTLLPLKRHEDIAEVMGVDPRDALSLSTVTTPL